MPSVQYKFLSLKLWGHLSESHQIFTKKYRNDCGLTSGNQNCDFRIRFQTPGGKWLTIVKSRHNLKFFWGNWTNRDQIYTMCRENIAIEYFWIEIAII